MREAECEAESDEISAVVSVCSGLQLEAGGRDGTAPARHAARADTSASLPPVLCLLLHTCVAVYILQLSEGSMDRLWRSSTQTVSVHIFVLSESDI